MTDPFDIPLFREIQRLLASSEGPINLEFARQTATAIATGGSADPSPTAGDVAAYRDAVHSAQAIVAGYSRLQTVEAMRAEVIGRSRWIASTLEAWRPVLEQLATRFVGELERLGPEAPETPDDATSNPLQVGLAQVAPLLIGMQAGMLVGHLAKETLARYDVPIPRSDEGQLFFVLPNISALEDGYNLPHDRLRSWLALHSVARRAVEDTASWLNRYWRGLLGAVIDAIEIDAGDLERRLAEMQTGGMEALQEGALPLVHTEHYERALARLRAFGALFEGYANHVCGVVAAELIPEAGRIDEAMARRDASPSEGRRFLSTVLGVSIDRALEQSGTTFCAAVVKLKGIDALNKVWAAPDNLPSLDEIKDPFAWMDRVLADD